MIATMTVQSQRMSQSQDHHFSRNSNTAGAPLPLIPRRPSSSRPAITSSYSLPSTSSSFSSSSSSTTTVTTITSPTRNDSDSSSSSPSSDGTRPTIRTRRIRGVRPNPVCPPELSTPIPTLTIATSSSNEQQHLFPTKSNSADPSPQSAPARPLLYTPGMPLRTGIKSTRNVSDSSHVSPAAETSPSPYSSHQSSSALCESFGEARMIRKKSGQVVKSSLKSSRSSSSARGSSLSVVTLTQASKSEPNTPTSKAVHFDAKLEHVKLFLAEQKPLAVSRDGSPTDDTSGTDSDFPRFIFDDAAAAAGERSSSAKRRLVMQVANMPARRDPAADVALEELCLAPDGASIQGKVRVRNLAFAKWIAVRFTFDSWQTTSEVTGRYVESLGPLFDRFAFTIRLNDLLARIEGKTLIVAVRYSVEGREVWDNNAGQNYVATFTKGKAEAAAAPTAPMMMTRKMTTLSDDEASSDMMDLRSKLEKVVNTKERTGPAFVAQQARGKQLASAPADADATSFRSSTSFASRYDFAASLKSSWNPDAHVSMHSRTQSFPLTTHAKGAAHGHSGSSSSVAWPQRSPSDPSDPSAFRRTSPQPPSTTPLPPLPLAQTQQTKSKPAPTPTPTPTTVLGSPRDIGDDASFHAAVSSSRSPLPLPSLPGITTTASATLKADHNAPFQPQQHPRHHQRGYFDLPSTPTSAPPTSAVKRTPPGTPRSPGEVFVPSPRFNSFPPLGVEFPLRNDSIYETAGGGTGGGGDGGGGGGRLTTPAPPFLMSDSSGDSTSSELSTPSMVTPSSSRESTPEPESMSPIGDARGMGMFGQQMSPETHYRQFLSKFCFFTGPGSAATLVDGDEGELLPRTHSASDIEEFLTGLSPNLHQLEQVPLSPYNIQHGHGHGHYVHPHPHPHAHAYTSPSRSSSLDDLTLNRSGSLTPTVSRLALAMNSTPVM